MKGIEQMKMDIEDKLIPMTWYSLFVTEPEYIIQELQDSQLYCGIYRKNLDKIELFPPDSIEISLWEESGVSVISVRLPKDSIGLNHYTSYIVFCYTHTMDGTHECAMCFVVRDGKLFLIRSNFEQIVCGDETDIIRSYFRYARLMRADELNLKNIAKRMR